MSFKDLLGFPKNQLGQSLPNTGERWTVDVYGPGAGLFKPSAGFGTISSYFARYRRQGDELAVFLSFTCGTVANSPGKIVLPAFWTIDLAKASTIGDIVGFGQGGGQAIGASSALCIITSNNGTPPTAENNYVLFQQGTPASGAFAGNNVTNYATSNQFFSCYFTVPILQFAQ